MSTVPIAEQKPARAVLICAACGKLINYEHGYHADPSRKAFDGGKAVFGKRCYRPDTPLAQGHPAVKQNPSEEGWTSRFTFAFESKDDQVRVYHLRGEMPEELRHDPKRERAAAEEENEE